MAYTTIDNPGLFFNSVIYSGSNSDQSITGVGFQPDWVWIKNRSSTPDHMLNDVVRGAGKQINSNTTTAELDRTYFKSFDSDGFSLEGNVSDYNQNSSNFVSWNWKAGNSSGSSNGDGSITSTVSANTTAGFSIVSYTGTGSNATVGHGLGVAPSLIINKCRSATQNWATYHAGIGATKAVFLDGNDTATTSSSYFNNTAPTTSVFTVGTSGDTNKSSQTHISYCFAEKKGYSKFGIYTGQGGAGGQYPFIYTGFKPAWIIIKDTGSTQSWFMYDNKRDTINPNTKLLTANNNSAEEDSASTGNTFDIDFVSNGFKIRTTDAGVNTNGNEYIYSVFAETPFVTAGTKAAGTAK